MRTWIRNSNLPMLFNFHDDRAKGRCVMLSSSIAVNIITWLTTGFFYTGFLLDNGINIVNIGVISFVPYIASCFSVFSPSILERFRYRRWTLAAARATYYTLQILAVTIMPKLIVDPDQRVSAFVVIILVANIVNALFANGYTAWHVNFIPETLRAGYFATATTITSFVGIGMALVSAIIADAFSASPQADDIIVLLRYVAYGLGLLDVFVLSLPKEYAYPQTVHPRLAYFFLKPLRHKRFLLTMIIVLLFTIEQNIAASALTVYLLDDVGVSYTFIQLINFVYPICLLLLSKFAQNNIRKLGWFKTFALFTLLQAPTTLLYSCIGPGNYYIILPVVRITQHIVGLSANIAYANMAYVNLPREDQTNYTAFYTFIVSFGAFLGLLLGTGFLSFFPDAHITLAGLSFGNVQMLLWMQAVMQVILPGLTFLWLKQLTPQAEA